MIQYDRYQYVFKFTIIMGKIYLEHKESLDKGKSSWYVLYNSKQLDKESG